MVVLASCGNSTDSNNSKESKTMPKGRVEVADLTVFGNDIAIDKAADVRRLTSLLGDNTNLNVKLIGKVENVCQASGCWLDMDLGDGKTLHVTFKDEAFVVPKDMAGKIVLIEGVATTEIVPVDLQKKIAKDEGLSQKEINAITSPATEYYFETTGVVIK